MFRAFKIFAVWGVGFGGLGTSVYRFDRKARLST